MVPVLAWTSTQTVLTVIAVIIAIVLVVLMSTKAPGPEAMPDDLGPPEDTNPDLPEVEEPAAEQ